MTDSRVALVFEPHNDDFVIGMGATGVRLLEVGWEVVSAVLTDGRFGSTRLPPDETREVRAAEKAREARRLGIDYRELGYADQGLAATVRSRSDRRAAVRRLTELVESVDPDVVFVPASTDGHPDHRATHDLATAAVDAIDRSLATAEYVIWQIPFVATRAPPVETVLTVPADETFDEKLAAIRVHESQLDEYPYDDIVSSYDRFLGSIYHPHEPPEYVELFHLHDRDATPEALLAETGARDVTDVYHEGWTVD